MANPYTTIRIERRGHVAEVVLNTPDRLNAMSIKFFHEIKAARRLPSRLATCLASSAPKGK